ncbi:MAG: divalent cation tolerance protein CutA [Patescibacteria group bacterium]
MTDMILVYVTCKSVEQAKKFGRHLLKKRLCGCVNIFPNVNPHVLVAAH